MGASSGFEQSNVCALRNFRDISIHALCMSFTSAWNRQYKILKYAKEWIFADDGDSRVDLATKINSIFYLIDQLVEFFMRV